MHQLSHVCRLDAIAFTSCDSICRTGLLYLESSCDPGANPVLLTNARGWSRTLPAGHWISSVPGAAARLLVMAGLGFLHSLGPIPHLPAISKASRNIPSDKFGIERE